MPTTQKQHDQLIAKQAIYELSCRYMRGLDRLDKHLLLSVFSADAWCEYGFINCDAPAFVDFAIGALTEHTANQHMIGNVLIEFEGNEAFGEVYFNAYHKVPSDEGFDDIVIAGRYLDRYVEESNEWKFAYRSELVDWSRTTSTNDPYFAAAPDGLRGARQKDAVYDTARRYRPDQKADK
ncbi:MAG: nuclear transport factor 2 family protein [Halioglobus sp.]